MKLKNKYIALFLTASSFATAPLMGDCCSGSCGPKTCGKVDIGPAYVHIDMLRDKDTVEKMDIPAVRGDLCYAVWKGLLVKPTITYGYNDQELFMTGVGLGQIIPINDSIKLTPVAGFTYSFLTTDASLPLLAPGVDERSFRSYGGYIGIEGTYSVCKTVRIYASYQYAWTRNVNKYSFAPIFGSGALYSREHSSGSAISVMVEQDLTKCWSVNIAGAYNNSMSKERNGMRAYGCKLGIVRWF